LACDRPIHRSHQSRMIQGAPHAELVSRAIHQRRTSNPFHALCDACLHTIPWIHTIRCPVCGRAIGCPDCSRRGQDRTYFLQNRSAVAYSPQMREWLAAYKYWGDERFLHLLGSMLLSAYYQVCSERHGGGAPARFDCITYVPVSPSRLQERGFNQAEQFAHILHRYTGVPVIPLLQRNRHTVKQSMKSRMDRIEDMKDVFLLSPQFSPDLRLLSSGTIRILLIDDVYTTGSTVNACAKALHGLSNHLEASIYITSLTWARS